MEYKLFDEFITLQALLKELGIIPSGGAAKSFLQEYPVLLNGQAENRRGKKLRLGDRLELEVQGIQIFLTEPSQEERSRHEEEKAEKARVAALVKSMNKDLKKTKKPKKTNRNDRESRKAKAPVRFPGR